MAKLITEISKKLASNYLGKAIKNKHHQGHRYDRYGNRDDGDDKDPEIVRKRDKGINLAAKKLHNKEPHGKAKVPATEEVKSTLRSEIEGLFEEGNILHKKGRPKKNRHEDGKIVND